MQNQDMFINVPIFASWEKPTKRALSLALGTKDEKGLENILREGQVERQLGRGFFAFINHGRIFGTG
nr:hypothetical protein BgiMline_021326 [Biomphalaria glabrata]